MHAPWRLERNNATRERVENPRRSVGKEPTDHQEEIVMGGRHRRRAETAPSPSKRR